MVVANQIQSCINCNAENDGDDLYCVRCGYILPSALKNTDETSHRGGGKSLPVDVQWGTGYFHPSARLILRLDGTDKFIEVQFNTQVEVSSLVVGRKTEGSDPDQIDLSPLGALSFGVSRRHVRLDRVHNSIHVTDLRSANGTFLNAERMVPGIPQILRNHATLQVGKMVLRVQFA